MRTDEKILKLLESQKAQLDRIEKLLKSSDKKTIKKIKQDSAKTKEAKKGSISEYLRELKKDGFFKEPRESKDIVSKLKEYGHHYSPQSLTWSLQHLVQKRELGRITNKGKWNYVQR